MIGLLLRLGVYVSGIYSSLLVAFPQWEGQTYHVASLALIAGGAVGLIFFFKMVEIGSRLTRLAIELVFAAGVFLYFGYTMPQKSGKPPIQQWMEGYHPTQTHARDGLSRVGLDPNSKPSQWIVALFPKS